MNRIILLALIATAVAESTSVVQATESGSAAESGAKRQLPRACHSGGTPRRFRFRVW